MTPHPIEEAARRTTIVCKLGVLIDSTALISTSAVLGDHVTISPFCNIYGDVKIGDGTKIGAYTEIGGATIGKRCKIEARVFIPPGVTIGDEVFIGPGVIFTNDKYPTATGEWHRLETRIEDYVSIGAGAIILPGVRIGRAAMIGAGAIITYTVLPGEIIVGSAARRVLDSREKKV